jgi:hypothetical protein
MEDSWKDIQIAHFDDLVDSKDLFKLCIAIGRSLHQRDSWNIVFKFQNLELFNLLSCLVKLYNVDFIYVKEPDINLGTIQDRKPCVLCIEMTRECETALSDKTKKIPLDILNGNCVQIWRPPSLSCLHWTIPTFINDPNNLVNGKAVCVIKGIPRESHVQLSEIIPLHKLAYKCTLAYQEVSNIVGSTNTDALFEFLKN